jgi:hypothetical protein
MDHFITIDLVVFDVLMVYYEDYIVDIVDVSALQQSIFLFLKGYFIIVRYVKYMIKIIIMSLIAFILISIL